MSFFSDLMVLDLSRYLPGGYATQMLADWGAEVVKVEDTGTGDFSRAESPLMHGVSFYHTALDRNKKSISLNLKKESAHEAFLKLVAEADVLVESFRPGVTERLGIDYECLRRINSGLVYCSITAYGQGDSRSRKAAHDINMMAQCGFLDLNEGRVPLLPWCDLAASMVAGQSILAALCERERCGSGAYCDVSMFDSFVWWNSLLDARYDFNGGRLEMEDLEHPSAAYNVYPTADGKLLSTAMIENKFWDPFCEEMGLDAETRQNGRTNVHRDETAHSRVAQVIAGKTLAEWEKWIGDRDVCMSPVRSKEEAIVSIVGSGSGMMMYREYPRCGSVLQTDIPHRVTTLPTDLAGARPPRELGEDTCELLRRIGYDDETIGEMAREGAVKIHTGGIG